MSIVRTCLAAACVTSLGVTIACSGGHGSVETSKNQQDLQMCFGDSGVCIDADVPGFPDGGFGSFDAGWSWPGYDAGTPSWDASGALFGYCGWDPKYITEYNQAVASFTVKPCMLGCAATECCYYNLACVAQ